MTRLHRVFAGCPRCRPVVLAVLALIVLTQVAPFAAPASGQSAAVVFPKGVDVNVSLDAPVEKPSATAAELRLSRLKLQPGQGVPTGTVNDALLLLVESGSLTVVDELGIEGTYPEGSQLTVLPKVLFALRNDTSDPVSLLLLTLTTTTSGAGTAATPVASGTPAATIAIGDGETLFAATADPALFPADLFLARVSWAPGTDSGTHTFPGPVAFLAESGALAVTGPSGIEGQLKPGKPIVFPAGKPNRQRNTATDPATLLVAGLIPSGATLFQPVEGGAPAIAASVGTPAAGVGTPQAASTTGNAVPMFRGNPAHTGDMPGPGPDPDREVVDRWTFTTGAAVTSSPIVVDGVVYLSGSDSNLYAIDAATGKEKWSFKTGNTSTSGSSSPALEDGVIYVGSDDGNVYAVNAANGSLAWQFATGGAVRSSPAVISGVVYFGSDDGNVYAVTAADGSELWRFATGKEVRSSPAVVDGVVYVGSFDRNLYALNASDGTERWRFATGGEVYSSPAVADGIIYFGSEDNNVYALNAEDGTELWRLVTQGYVDSSPAIANGVVYVGSNDRNVYALNAADGTEIWRFEAPNWVQSSPAVVNGIVIVGCNDGTVFVLNTKDGEPLWKGNLGASLFSSPAVVGGAIYIGIRSTGDMYAIGAAVPVLKSGGTAMVTKETALRGAPAPSGVVRATLPAGTALDVTGDPVKTATTNWWPVTDKETGVSGWVDEADIAPS